MSSGLGAPASAGLRRNTRRSRALFHWRADECSLVALTGQAGTFTRAGKGGSVVDRAGRVVHQYGTAKPRWGMFDLDGDGVREQVALLFDPNLDNKCLYSEDFTNAAWTKTNVTVGTLAVPDVFGAAASQRLLETVTNGVHFCEQDITVTAGEYVSASVFVKAAGRFYAVVSVGNTADSNRIQSQVNLQTGVINAAAIGSGDRRGSWATALGDGWWEIGVAGKIDAVATTARFRVRILDDTASSSYTGDTAKGLYYTGAQLARCGTTGPEYASYLGPTTASALSRGLESLHFDVSAFPITDALTLYARGPRLTTDDWSGILAHHLFILRLGTSNPQGDISHFSDARQMRAALSDATPAFSAAYATTPGGAVLECVGQLLNWRAGTGQVRVDVGSGFGAYATAISTPVAALASSTLVLGNAGVASTYAPGGGICSVKIAAGLLSLAEMRELL